MAAAGEAGDGEIVHGALVCERCGARYHVREGIADFIGVLEPRTPAQIVNQTRLAAWGYERLWRPFALTLLTGRRFPYRRELPLMVALAGARRGGLFVDVACSNGLYARALARVAGAAGHVVGVDHSLPMLREARRRARAAGLRITYVRARAEALPVLAATAAGVAIGGSLNEIVDVDGTLREVRRVLAKDGRFMAMTLARARSWWGRALQAVFRPGGVEFRAADAWVDAFRQHGLETVERQQYRVVLFTCSLVYQNQNHERGCQRVSGSWFCGSFGDDMAKAALLFVGTDDGLVMFSDPGGVGRWLRIGRAFDGAPVQAVWAQPDDPQVLLAAAGRQLQRSEDGGRSWQPLRDHGDVQALHGDRSTPHEVALVTGSGARFVSHDAGRTWTADESGDAAPTRTEATLPGREPVLLRVAAGGIERSADHGVTWQPTAADAPWNGAVTVVQPSGYHIDTAFAGSAGGQIAISTDRGRTWQMIRQDLPLVRSIAAARVA
jgi:SAM-dependent methyltransferase/photosystem II stability/assembly factor-like uncharacterized protein